MLAVGRGRAYADLLSKVSRKQLPCQPESLAWPGISSRRGRDHTAADAGDNIGSAVERKRCADERMLHGQRRIIRQVFRSYILRGIHARAVMELASTTSGKS